MKPSFILLAAFFLTGCQSWPENYNTVGEPTRRASCPDYSKVESGYYGGDGSSSEQALEIVGFDYSFDHWLQTKHPGSKVVIQELILDTKYDMKYDLFTVELPDGSSTSIWVWLTGGWQCM